ncbi:MAG: hypothetical protein HY966_04860, partial [Ignavibacteriales bacterium]|nr:hypothetical protein [Ignavibacteriales bacterium]
MTNAIPHESAALHVSGEAVYIDDIAAPPTMLAGHVVYSSHAHARVVSFDLSKARLVPGIAAILSAKDIPGHNQVGPVVKDELCLADGEVHCVGQAMFLIAAQTVEQCRQAEKLIGVKYEPLHAILSIEDAIERNSLPDYAGQAGLPDYAGQAGLPDYAGQAGLLGPPRTMSR